MAKFTFPIVLVVAAVLLGCAPLLHDAYIDQLLLRALQLRSDQTMSFAPPMPGVFLTTSILGVLSLLAGIVLGWKISLRPD